MRIYEGYEGEPKILLRGGNNATIHIWEGYFDDIFDTPSLDGNGWIGFTRDYHQFEGAFSEEADETIPVEIDLKVSRPTYSADLREDVSVEYIACEAGEDILDEEA